MKTYLTKAIGDLEPGKEGKNETTSYTHLLDPKLRDAGIELNISDEIHPVEGPIFWVAATAPRGDDPEKRMFIGNVTAQPIKPYVKVANAKVHPEMRQMGLGMAMYEAMMVHAKNKHGLTRVKGGKHSSSAHKLHQKLAEKHGLSYEAPRNIGDWDYETPHEWHFAPNESYDGKYGPYSYTIKSDPEDFMAPLKKEEKTIAVPARYLKKQERNLEGWKDLEPYEAMAIVQSGYIANAERHLEAARRMMGLKKTSGIPLGVVLDLFKEEEDDVADLALRAYGIVPNEQSRQALDMLLREPELLKEESALMSYRVAPVHPESVETADAVQRAIDSGYLNPVKLNGKHSKGTMIAKDPQTKKIWLLKPGSGRNSPALGVNENTATQSEREAAFWHVADYIGIGDAFPRADLVYVNNHQTAAMELLPMSFHNLGTKKKEDPNLPARILEPYRSNGTLFKWSFIDFILGNPDRHSQNMMVDPNNRVVRLIDHGSALAGPSFSPSTDENSFIPYYLRAWTNKKFTQMNPQERVRAMPGCSPRVEQIIDEWVAGINEGHIMEILKDYKVDPSAVLDRLAQIRAMPGPKWMVLNKLWAGAV